MRILSLVMSGLRCLYCTTHSAKSSTENPQPKETNEAENEPTTAKATLKNDKKAVKKKVKSKVTSKESMKDADKECQEEPVPVEEISKVGKKLKKNGKQNFQLFPWAIRKIKKYTTEVPNLSETQICASIYVLFINLLCTGLFQHLIPFFSHFMLK